MTKLAQPQLTQTEMENRKLALQLAVSIANVTMQTEPGRISRGVDMGPVNVTKLAKELVNFIEGRSPPA